MTDSHASGLPHANEAFLTRVFDSWRTEFRAILEGHKRDIEARLEKIERGLDKKSDKEHVEILVRGLSEDLNRHAKTIQGLQIGLSNKLGTETMWKIVALVLTLSSGMGGLIGFLLNLLL